jgi:glutathione S-transferase
MMLLYSGPLSLFSKKVEIALAEKGLAFERVMVPFNQIVGYSPKHPVVAAKNPKGQVPVLIDGGLSLYDSTLILEYLEDAYPLPPLFPKEPAARARCRLLEIEADDILLQPVRKLMHRSEPPGPDAQARARKEDAASHAEAEIVGNYEAVSAKLGGREFLCGEFTVADIATFMTIHYGLRLGAPALANTGNLAAWYENLKARPSFARVVSEVAAADLALSHPVANRRA